MPRTESYLLRLTKAEKDELGRRAEAEGISIAKLIRRRLKLDATEREKPPQREEPPSREKEFNARVEELSRTMPRPNAELVARKELI